MEGSEGGRVRGWRPRHCERSEAIQSRERRSKDWIASSQALLAMTGKQRRFTHTAVIQRSPAKRKRSRASRRMAAGTGACGHP